MRGLALVVDIARAQNIHGLVDRVLELAGYTFEETAKDNLAVSATAMHAPSRPVRPRR